jgi:hypothetical protein
MEGWAVDAYAPALAKVDLPANRKILGPMPGSLQTLPESSVDAAICLDVIEHFEKPAAVGLIRELEYVARKLVVLFTPLGFMPQEGYESGGAWQPWQKHRCGFEADELEGLGYTTTIWEGFDYGKGRHDALWGVKAL